MPAQVNFIIGISSCVFTPISASAITVTGLLRLDFRDGTQQNGEGYDDDVGYTQLWNGPLNGRATLSFRDPAKATAFTDAISDGTVNGQGTLVVVGTNRQAGGANQTHTFTPLLPAQVGGDLPGGNQAPESISVAAIYGVVTIEPVA